MGAFVWGYALAWFLVNDRVKLLAYRILDRAKAKPATALEPSLEAKPRPTTPSLTQRPSP